MTTDVNYNKNSYCPVQEVNLGQIGLSRPEGEPCVPLLIKALFTCMFWVTLRQRVQEIRERRRSTVITDMAAPLQLTVSTAASGQSAHLRTSFIYIVGRSRPGELLFLGSTSRGGTSDESCDGG